MDAQDYLDRFNGQMGHIVGIVETLQVNDKITLPKLEEIVITFEDIKRYLNIKSKASKRYIVTETETEFIIHRMVDNVNIGSIYEKIKPIPEQKAYELDEKMAFLRKLVATFNNLDLKRAASYGCEKHYLAFKKEKIIPYAFFQRNTSSAPCFKNTPEGATKTLQNVLSTLCKNEVFFEIPNSVVFREFGIASKLYLILKEI